MSANYAYVTMATSKNYLPGLMAMYLSLKQTGTHIPLYAMVPHNLVVAEPKAIDSLQKSGVNILKYSHSVDIPQQLIDNNATQGDHRFSHTFDKLLIFGLTQFDKIVFLDADGIEEILAIDGSFAREFLNQESAVEANFHFAGREAEKIAFFQMGLMDEEHAFGIAIAVGGASDDRPFFEVKFFPAGSLDHILVVIIGISLGGKRKGKAANKP